ncbi:hypothetical protein IG631_16778 [Alternaria alternata]|nr:hypothetical protein IG631_16778 [Alternaria alternata]
MALWCRKRCQQAGTPISFEEARCQRTSKGRIHGDRRKTISMHSRMTPGRRTIARDVKRGKKDGVAMSRPIRCERMLGSCRGFPRCCGMPR